MHCIEEEGLFPWNTPDSECSSVTHHTSYSEVLTIKSILTSLGEDMRKIDNFLERIEFKNVSRFQQNWKPSKEFFEEKLASCSCSEKIIKAFMLFMHEKHDAI